MAAKTAAVLLTSNWGIWMFGFIYTIINILMITFHYNIAPVMLAWIDTAPLDKNVAIDNVQPWNKPEEVTAALVETVVDEEEVEEEEDEDEEAEEEDEDEDGDEAF